MSATEAFFASRSMQALEVLAFGPSTATRVAAELQVHPRTARRLLNRMVHDGWLLRRDGRRPTYTPTMRIVALAAQLAERSPLVRHGMEVARELQAATGGAVHLAVPSYRSALRLVRATGTSDCKPELRDLAPAHAIAAGKLLLAFRHPWRDVVLGAPLAPVTERTVTDADAMRADLHDTRERGYAVEDEEFRPGVRAIAHPVRSAEADVVAALALSSVAGDVAALERAGDALAAAAGELSGRLLREAA
jgi:DNA-binding IclR family transcriptional regulator